MDYSVFLKLLDVLIWPATTVFLSIVFRRPLSNLVSRSEKVKVSIFGVSFESTISELERTISASLGGKFTQEHWDLISSAEEQGAITYEPPGVPKDRRDLVRETMNAGLVMTLPRRAHLGDALGIAATPLGRLLLQARRKADENRAT